MVFKRKPSCGSTCAKFAGPLLDPGMIPPELRGLTAVEQQLIARVHPVVCVYKIRGHQYGYRGNVINFPQSVNELARTLPHRLQDLTSMLAVRMRDSAGFVDFNVRCAKVRGALLWLREHNTFYFDVEISEENLAELPEDGSVFMQLQGYDRVQQEDDPEEDTGAPQGLPLPGTPAAGPPPSANDADGNGATQQVAEGDDLEQRGDDVAFSGVPMLEPHHQGSQVLAVLNWPTIGSRPVDEFRTPGYITMAFPTLFPYGRADISALTDCEQRIQLAEYFRFLMYYRDGRFADDPRFRFFAFNTMMRQQALRAGNLYVQRNAELQGKTVQQLRRLVRQRPDLVKSIMFYGNKLHGTRQYWGARLSELLDMVEQLGLPTLFMTLSAADLHWPDLFRLILDSEGLTDDERVMLDELAQEQRRNLIADHPFVPSIFFMKRADYFMTKILRLLFKVKDLWFRYEWQFRGSPHIHGLIWIDGAPDVTQLKQMSPEEFKATTTYFAGLVSAWNVGIGLAPAAEHPCRVRLSDIALEDRERCLGELLNRVQRHTRCSEGYCLRRVKRVVDGEQVELLQCRFKFPFVLAAEDVIIFDEKGEPAFIPRRNDPLLNNFNRIVIEAWRGNVDFKPVTSEQGCVNYLVKYTAKPEKKSKTMQELFDDAVTTLDDDDSARKAIQRRCIQSISERDYSSQEVIHLLTSQKLFRCTRTFVKIVFSSSGWVGVERRGATGDSDSQDDVGSDDGEDGEVEPEVLQDMDGCQEDEEKTKGSVLEKYPKRPRRMSNVTLWEFARNFRWSPQKKRCVICASFPFSYTLNAYDGSYACFL